jgi:hypothetical protein
MCYAPWGGQSWPQPPFQAAGPAEGRLRAKLPAPQTSYWTMYRSSAIGPISVIVLDAKRRNGKPEYFVTVTFHSEAQATHCHCAGFKHAPVPLPEIVSGIRPGRRAVSSAQVMPNTMPNAAERQ